MKYSWFPFFSAVRRKVLRPCAVSCIVRELDSEEIVMEDLFAEGDDSFGRPAGSNPQLFQQIRVQLLMNVHKVSQNVAVMMMKANDKPKSKTLRE